MPTSTQDQCRSRGQHLRFHHLLLLHQPSPRVRAGRNQCERSRSIRMGRFAGSTWGRRTRAKAFYSGLFGWETCRPATRTPTRSASWGVWTSPACVSIPQGGYRVELLYLCRRRRPGNPWGTAWGRGPDGAVRHTGGSADSGRALEATDRSPAYVVDDHVEVRPWELGLRDQQRREAVHHRPQTE